MSSTIEICNAALSIMGSRSTISDFSEGSAESINCAIWYDRLRKQLIRAAPWGFARTQAALTTLGTLVDNTSPYPWPYMYSYPNDCLRLRYIIRDSRVDGVWPLGASRNNRFLINSGSAGRTILANIPNAIAVYTKDESNVDMFDPLFEEALIQLLAAHLIIPLSGNAGMKSQLVEFAKEAVLSARAVDGNEALPSTDHTPDWIAARGIGADCLTENLLGQWYCGYDNVSWGE